MIYLRKANTDDVNLLYRWANDPDVRKCSFHSEQIAYEDHIRWFENVMGSDKFDQYILIDEDTAVGQIRIQIEDEEAEISYSIGREHRGNGYGRLIVQKLFTAVRKDHPEVKRLTARVKPDNVASKKVFEREGYSLKYIDYEISINFRGGVPQ